MTNVLLEIFLQIMSQVWRLQMHSCSLSVVHHMMSLIIDMKIIRPCWAAHFVHELLDFVDELQCGESWENIPLEFHRLTINCIQSSVLW